jgi:hypothetical protein
MALKHPEPLTENEWNSFMKKLNTPPTEEQKRMMEQAEENGKKIETHLWLLFDNWTSSKFLWPKGLFSAASIKTVDSSLKF